jgi:hypothetical protein
MSEGDGALAPPFALIEASAISKMQVHRQTLSSGSKKQIQIDRGQITAGQVLAGARAKSFGSHPASAFRSDD